MIKLIISFLLIASVFLFVIDELTLFFHNRSIYIVLAGALSFAIFGKDNPERLQYFSKGAVTFGWLGVLFGAIMLLANLEVDPAGIGPAMSIMLLTALYGHMVQAACFLIKANSLIK